MTAHITKRSYGYDLAISPTVRAADATSIYVVKTKGFARQLAKKLGAQPWNF